MKILTFDIEEWYFEKNHIDREKKFSQLNEMLDRILSILERRKISATFFCLGQLAIDFPEIVKKITHKGHEIGCHSLKHKWINKITRSEFIDDTTAAIEALESVTNKKIISYRAPAFSITESSKWAFEILSDLGIKNDASIFPTTRDFGGYKNFPIRNSPCIINIGNNKLINEFPINLTRIPIIKRDIAFSGGGYFRLLPLNFIEKQINKSSYLMCYFHLGDLVDYKTPLMTKKGYESYFKETGSIKNRYLRYFKSNIGRERAFQGFSELINKYDFISIREASKFYQNFKEIALV